VRVCVCAGAAVAIAVASSGGRVVKKAKGKQAVRARDEVTSMPIESTVLIHGASLPSDEDAQLVEAARGAKPAVLAQIGAHARAARASKRAEAALAQRVPPTLSPTALASAGPVPVLSAAASVVLRKARLAHEANAADAAAERRADELRLEMDAFTSGAFTPRAHELAYERRAAEICDEVGAHARVCTHARGVRADAAHGVLHAGPLARLWAVSAYRCAAVVLCSVLLRTLQCDVMLLGDHTPLVPCASRRCMQRKGCTRR
jgi:hypothetical protein